MENIIRKIFLVLIMLTAIYRVTSSQTKRTGLNSEIPEASKNMTYKSFKLYQNEPEIFSKVTSIKFDLLKDGNVNLGVYDMSGNLVELLAEGEMQRGKYNVYFKASETLTAGEYYYILKVDGLSKSMKMVLKK